MILGKLPGPGRPTIWMTVGQGPTALAVGAGGCCLDIFYLLYLFSPISPSPVPPVGGGGGGVQIGGCFALLAGG